MTVAEQQEIPVPRRCKDRDPKATETELLDLLERMLAKHGNGGSGEYAFMRQVRNAAGFNANRTFDGVSVGLWPSRGHDIHVYEVKVSRSDWQRELAKPQKAEDAAKIADRFSIVAPRDVVPIAEVPATWGLIHASGGKEVFDEEPPLLPGGDPVRVRRIEGRKLRVVRAAPLLRPAEECRGPISRSLLVPLLRAAGAVPPVVTPSQSQINEAVQAALREDREYRKKIADRNEQDRARTERTLRAFQQAAGLWFREHDATQAGERVRAALDATSEPRAIRHHVERALTEMDRLSSNLRSLLEKADL